MLIQLNLTRDQPLQRQLYDQLRDLIRSSRLLPGARMPSTRLLAERFGVSRITVLLTYEKLIADGLLETRRASGTFVCQPPAPVHPVAMPELSAREAPGGVAARRTGSPDPSLFPLRRWRALMGNALDQFGAEVRSKQLGGCPALRREVAAWVSASRGMAVCPNQVVVLQGRPQALHLVAHLAAAPGQRVVIEDPTDADIAATLGGLGANLMRIPVDEAGLLTDRLPSGRVALIHVTPEHQRPLGVSLSDARRGALLEWAEGADALVLEDHCDGELRYTTRDVASLRSQDRADRVVLLGGFCASLGPWLGLSYLVLPHRLVGPALAALALIDDGRHRIEETALAELLGSGSYARHLHLLGKTYAARRDALLAALAQNFGPAPILGGQAGLHLTWLAPPQLGPGGYLAALARRCGLEAASVSPDVRARFPAGWAVLLGFGALPPEQIVARVGQFAALVEARPAELALSAD